MKLPALWCALAVLLPFLPLPAAAQTPPPFYVSGPAPDPFATVCPGEPAALPSVVAPARVAISAASIANFKTHDTGDRIELLIGMRQDGHGEAYIPPTNDIDPELRQALAAFARGVTIKSPLPGCARWAALVIVSINAPDGTVRTVQTLQPPPKQLPRGIPLASPSPSAPTPTH
jgi:hypothetical protein